MRKIAQTYNETIIYHIHTLNRLFFFSLFFFLYFSIVVGKTEIVTKMEYENRNKWTKRNGITERIALFIGLLDKISRNACVTSHAFRLNYLQENERERNARIMLNYFDFDRRDNSNCIMTTASYLRCITIKFHDPILLVAFNGFRLRYTAFATASCVHQSRFCHYFSGHWIQIKY